MSKDGAFHFPVFHRDHPCLDSSPAAAHAASVSDAGTVIADDKIHKGKYLMAISLGTPAVFNLVAIDTGSTLSWVPCRRCQIFCHHQVSEAGRIFDPENSTTYRHIGCSNEGCIDLHHDNGVPYGCIEESDTCLYLVRYGSSQYSVGKLGTDRLALGDNYTVSGGFIFGCSEDDGFKGYEAGVIGFGNKTYSYFNHAEACHPVDPGVDPSSYTRQMMIVDSGTDETFLQPPILYSFDDAMTAAMRDKGYSRGYDDDVEVCFKSASGGKVEWRDLRMVEMKFIRATMKLLPENVFHQRSADQICLAFQPDTAGVQGVQILGNKALRSFRVVYDLQKMTIGFQARAC
ncbi:hypothetical protein U9M48_034919 [Paspalum notatum var. saurae]|uniref:Peptidase A1 domain-containing protein n=1 Tax=Paspalum notatum var. saurae TaxID=547442 RepID=A0AAQ3X9G1_PASNO